MKFLLIFTLILPTILTENNGCKSRKYSSDSNVCVCDENYCDTIERYSRDEIGNLNFIKYTTNRDGLRFFKENGTFTPSTNTITVENGIYINNQVEYQNIVGFGGAFTDAFGYNFLSLNGTTRRLLIESYFSKDGIEYSLCRVPIGGTDFSLHGYSYDDGDVDIDLERFNLTQEDYDYKIPLIKTALNLTDNRLTLFTAAWTAPKWMKTNGEYSGFGFLIPEMYETWANYHLKFLEMYADNGIEFWAITTGNEPSLALIPFVRINSIAWLPNQIIKYVSKHLGPVLRNSTFKDIKLIILDDQRFFLPWFVSLVFNDEITRNYTDGIAVHWYYDSFFPASLLSNTHNKWPDKFILATEACNGDSILEPDVILGSWERAERYAKDIIEDMLNWVVGWVDWNMALNETGGPTYISNNVDSTIIVNATANEFYKQPTFYALGHFSKFVPTNSTRIDISSNLTNIQSVAFKTPNQDRVVVILNRLEEDTVVNLVDDSVGIASLNLTKKSITTIIY